MRTKKIEKMLEEQVELRLNKLEDNQDAGPSYKLNATEYKRLTDEINMLNKMRQEIHSDRLDRAQKYVEIGVRSAVPAIVTVGLAILGYGLEGLFGNACSKTLNGVITRSPRL